MILAKETKNSLKKELILKNIKYIVYFAAIWEIFAIFAFKNYNSNLKYGKEEDSIQSRLQRHVAEFW